MYCMLDADLLYLCNAMSDAARGFELTFKGPKEETHQLVEYGERKFDHLIMMTPSTSCKS